MQIHKRIIFIPNFSWLDNALNSLTEHKQTENKMTYHFSLVTEKWHYIFVLLVAEDSYLSPLRMDADSQANLFYTVWRLSNGFLVFNLISRMWASFKSIII